MTTTGVRKKLIEVALPLDAINKAAAREKSIRHGHPSTLHLWWARRPLAAARAVIFAQMVDDPSEYVDELLSDPATKRAAQRELKKRLTARASTASAAPATGNGNIRAGEKPGATDEAELRAPTLGDVAAELERVRLFGILEELVLWENTTNEEVLKRARSEIWQSWRRACAENAGTWPMRTELGNRMRAMDSNALASSIVLVCRRRSPDAPPATRREFLIALRSELPQALRLLQTGNVAPVDLAQAAIGPGMAVFTRYTRVLDAAGRPMSVRAALALINQTLDEVLAEQEGDFDADSRWALAWFEQHGFDDGDYGVAETLSKAKNTSVAGMVDAGIIASQGGKVRLLKPRELPDDWDPAADARLTAWEAVHHLIRVLVTRGETGAAALVAPLGGMAEIARELCYRLYTLCERKKRAAEALSYNSLVQSWSEIARLARSARAEQAALFADPS